MFMRLENRPRGVVTILECTTLRSKRRTLRISRHTRRVETNQQHKQTLVIELLIVYTSDVFVLPYTFLKGARCLGVKTEEDRRLVGVSRKVPEGGLGGR